MLTHLLPKALKDFLPYISPAAFKLVSKTELLKRLGQIASQNISSARTSELRTSILSVLPPTLTLTETSLKNSIEPKKLNEKMRASVGATILELYFSQLYNHEGVFCDLRFQHFACKDQTAGSILWNPPAYWFTFTDEFRRALIALYDGYYLHDKEKVDRAIRALGLVAPDADEETLERIRVVFQKHFGPDENSMVKFSLSRFKDSFHSIFEVLVSQQHQIPVDFALLGIYLVGLYWGLEQLDQGFDVEEIYLRVRARFAAHGGEMVNL
jgi:predicted unusual protein kinase regulating ubiquinone biosynthesis (AarF/ABC1/UbiB family)